MGCLQQLEEEEEEESEEEIKNDRVINEGNRNRERERESEVLDGSVPCFFGGGRTGRAARSDGNDGVVPDVS
uniref:Uncharacterized protein n=1 Tax=Caenorhabditis japonica TaxID=281687 RepID=A0A8R1EDS4_CAEJA